MECLEEEQQSRNIAPFNATHQELRLVRSKKCHFYSGVMNKCKLECMEGSIDEENIYGRRSSNIKPITKYKRPNKPSALRPKGRAMAKGAKGKIQVILCIIFIFIINFINFNLHNIFCLSSPTALRLNFRYASRAIALSV